jgi:nucleotidyltransferase substrate binding protein (TIGR01987 family)
VNAQSHSQDVRWKQRFQNYRLALARLTEAVDLARQRGLSDLEKQGLVQAFEFTHEMAWNVLKDYLEEQGFKGVIGSKGATRQAFKDGLIEDGEIWMEMIQARNQTSHTYNLDVAERIVRDVLGRFHPAFVTMEKRFLKLEKEAD